MNSPLKVVVVAGYKPMPDYSTAWYNSLLAQNDLRFDFMALASEESRSAGISPNRIRYVWSKNIFYPFHIWKAVIREKPGLIHVQNEINSFGGGIGVILLPVLLGLLKISGFKVVTTIHAIPSPIDVRGNFSGLFSYPASSLFSCLMKVGLRGSYSLAVHLSDRCIVHTPLLKKTLMKHYGADETKIDVIPHLELDDENPTVSSPPSPMILCFGYLLRRKGIEELIRAFGQFAPCHPQHKLLIAGAASQLDYELELKILAKKQNGGDRIIFTGALDSKSVFDLFRECEFVALPALYSFSASGPYAIALAFEKPVIAPDIGYFSETIRDGIDGLLYRPGDIESVVRTLNLLAENPDLRQKLTRGMKEKRGSFTPDYIARQTLALYSLFSFATMTP